MASSSDSAQPAQRGFIPPRDEKERYLFHRMEELAQLSERQNMPRYSDFLSDREQSLAQAAMNRAGCTAFRFDGGYPEAERRVLCIEPEDTWQEMPIGCVKILVPFAESGRVPQHKDYMGSVLGLGLERRCIGDILLLPEAKGALLFLLQNKAEMVCRELRLVGNVPVRCTECDPAEAANVPRPERNLKTATLSSLRLDAFLAAALNCSRSLAAEYILGGRVEINHLSVQHPHEEIYEKDIFTVRGKGRFRLEKIGGKSRKDRIFVEFFQY